MGKYAIERTRDFDSNGQKYIGQTPKFRLSVSEAIVEFLHRKYKHRDQASDPSISSHLR